MEVRLFSSALKTRLTRLVFAFEKKSQGRFTYWGPNPPDPLGRPSASIIQYLPWLNSRGFFVLREEPLIQGLCPLILPRGLFSLYDFASRQNPGYGRRSAERIVASLLQLYHILTTIRGEISLRSGRRGILTIIRGEISLRSGGRGIFAIISAKINLRFMHGLFRDWRKWKNIVNFRAVSLILRD